MEINKVFYTQGGSLAAELNYKNLYIIRLSSMILVACKKVDGGYQIVSTEMVGGMMMRTEDEFKTCIKGLSQRFIDTAISGFDRQGHNFVYDTKQATPYTPTKTLTLNSIKVEKMCNKLKDFLQEVDKWDKDDTRELEEGANFAFQAQDLVKEVLALLGR